MQQPLAYRMRPTRIEDIVGQQDLVGPGKSLIEWSAQRCSRR